MEFKVLGPLDVRGDNGEPIIIRGSRERAILTVLLMAAGDDVADEVLVAAVWGEQGPTDPTAALQTAVSRLRRVLQPDGTADASVIERVPSGYRLAVNVEQIDWHRFEQLVADASAATDPRRIRDLLREALRMWRGAAYGDVEYEEFAQTEIRRLNELQLQANERLMAARLDLGEHQSGVADLESLVARFPTSETLWRQLMLALYRSGRQADALRTYHRARTAMGTVGIEPSGEMRQLEDRMLIQDPDLDIDQETTPPPPPTPPSRSLSNLPATDTSFIGRHEELARVEQMLTESRHVTLVGPGGVGKTRLVTELGHRVAPSYPDGVVFVRLAGVEDDNGVLSAVMAALDPEGQGDSAERLIGLLRRRRALLILDNCEQVLAGAAALTRTVLGNTRDVDVIATSRRRFATAGEHVWQLRPLGTAKTGPAGSTDAVALFVDRVLDVMPRISASDLASTDAVREIVERLDGLPLAIELAASQCFALTPEEVASGLRDSTGSLRSRGPISDRHSSLSSAIEWSLRRLDPAERAAFAAVSVIPDTWDLEAAEAVIGPLVTDKGPVADLILALVEHSLVTPARPEGTSARFSQLATIREAGQDLLAGMGESHGARQRHARWLAKLSQESWPDLLGPDPAPVVKRLRREQWNIDSAFDWAIDHEPQTALEIITGPRYRWTGIRPESAVLRSLARALAATTEPSLQRAHGLLTLAYLSTVPSAPSPISRSNIRFGPSALISESLRVESSDLVNFDAIELVADAVNMLEQLGEHTTQLGARAMEGFIRGTRGELEVADRMMSEVLDDARARGIDAAVEVVSFNLGSVRLALGDYAGAEDLYRTSYELATAADDIILRTENTDRLARTARAQGRYEEAMEMHHEALRLATSARAPAETLVHFRIELGAMAVELGRSEAVAEHVAVASELAEQHGLDRSLATIRYGQGEMAVRNGDMESATRHFDEAYSLAEICGDEVAKAYIWGSRGWAHLLIGSAGDAAEAFRAGFQADQQDGVATARILEGAAVIASNAGEYRTAARLLGAADALRESVRVPTNGTPQVGEVRADAERTLGGAFLATLAEGGELRADQYRSLALQALRSPKPDEARLQSEAGG
ncbi:MAG: BTAD domain-containing putative transcriptional regulator [Acidimicrobiia bacterium]|nr:BTAD domain-containing putative transcriptional regulator [Acidimicrobiia bacterium]